MHHFEKIKINAKINNEPSTILNNNARPSHIEAQGRRNKIVHLYINSLMFKKIFFEI